MDSPRAQQTTDPRLLRASTYSRQECIDVLTDFLAYLSIRLPYLDPSWILKPPPTGWPNITQKSLRPLAKSEEVVQLLSLLPYAHVPGQTDPFSMHRRWTAIMRDTHLYDFHDEVYQTAMRKEEARNWIQQPFLDVPGWVICLTTGLSHGNWLLLDTSDGRLYFSGIALLISQVLSRHIALRGSTLSQTMLLMMQELGATNVYRRRSPLENSFKP